MEHTVPALVLDRALRLATHSGIEVAPLLERARISSDVLVAPQGRVTSDQFSHLLEAIWGCGKDELLGLGPHPVRPGSCALLARAAIGAPDLATWLERTQQHIAVFPGLPPTTVEVVDQRLTISLDVSAINDVDDHVLTVTIVAVLDRFIGWLISKDVRLSAVRMPFPAPADADQYVHQFGRVPSYGHCRAELEYDAVILQSPVMRSDSELDEYLRQSPRTFLSRRTHSSLLADHVRRILESGLQGRWPSAEDVAASQSISLQHLRRKLLAEGTSVGQIREEILRDAAISSLVTGRESVEVLSGRLGFSDVRAFRRAFQRWTGNSPSAYRSSCAGSLG